MMSHITPNIMEKPKIPPGATNSEPRRAWSVALLTASEPGRRNRRTFDAVCLAWGGVVIGLSAAIAASAPEHDQEVAQALTTVLGWAGAAWRGAFFGALGLAFVIVVDVFLRRRTGPPSRSSRGGAVRRRSRKPPRLERWIRLVSRRGPRLVALGVPGAEARERGDGPRRRRPRDRSSRSAVRDLARAFGGGRRGCARRRSALGGSWSTRARCRGRRPGAVGVRHRRRSPTN